MIFNYLIKKNISLLIQLKISESIHIYLTFQLKTCKKGKIYSLNKIDSKMLSTVVLEYCKIKV